MSNRVVARIKPRFIRLEYSNEKQTIKGCYGGQRYESKGIELFNVNVSNAGIFTAGGASPAAVCVAGLAKHVKDLYMVKGFFQEIQRWGVRCGSSDISVCGGCMLDPLEISLFCLSWSQTQEAGRRRK